MENCRNRRPDRLESLHRFSSFTRHHFDGVGEGDVVSLINAGYSHEQVCGLFAHLAEQCGRA
jgi:hypothetical protein